MCTLVTCSYVSQVPLMHVQLCVMHWMSCQKPDWICTWQAESKARSHLTPTIQNTSLIFMKFHHKARLDMLTCVRPSNIYIIIVTDLYEINGVVRDINACSTWPLYYYVEVGSWLNDIMLHFFSTSSIHSHTSLHGTRLCLVSTIGIKCLGYHALQGLQTVP